MFDAQTYIRRREKLREQVGSGLALFLGNEESPMNYVANPYPFRQDSSFLYFFGLDYPGLAGIVDADEGKDIVFGDDVTMEDIIWMGSKPLLRDRAAKAGVVETLPASKLGEALRTPLQQGRRIHFLPPYRSDVSLKMSDMLGIKPAMVADYSSTELIKAVVAQRSIKSDEEIDQIEQALAITYEMYMLAMEMAKSGTFEREIAGKMEAIALSSGCLLAFPTILSIDGQILHNHYHGNRLETGKLVVCDSGAESLMHYASDITRTFPVGGLFTAKQKDIYEVVLRTQTTAIQAIKPDSTYKEVHLLAAQTTAAGLKALGLMKGDTDEAVEKGAHALFFPHGLGHQIGLDVHDMENLGEKFVGYDTKIERSEQFGLAYLRYGKDLKTGLVLTVEPGVYFIPALIDKWRTEGKFVDFIDYDRLESYKDFGGVRIEDNVLVTTDGARVLGKPIPKTVEQLRAVTGKD